MSGEEQQARELMATAGRHELEGAIAAALAAARAEGRREGLEEAAGIAVGCQIGIRDERWDAGYNRACEVVRDAILEARLAADGKETDRGK